MSWQASSRIVAVGVGCRAGVGGEAIAALVRRALEEAGAPEGERRMYTLDAKAAEPGLIEAARIIGVSLTPMSLAAPLTSTTLLSSRLLALVMIQVPAASWFVAEMDVAQR